MMKDENMNITITGMIGKRKEKALLKEAAEFFANQLMDPRMARNITLDIEVYNNLDVEGECVDEDGFKNPRWFTIGLKSQDIKDMIKTLGHEMVHVKQHAKNELQSSHSFPNPASGRRLPLCYQAATDAPDVRRTTAGIYRYWKYSI